MKIEVGMYVRTPLGISKYIGKWYDEDEMYEFDKLDEELWSVDICNVVYEYEIEKVVLKSSFEIIDLIEPMDLMYIDISPDDCGGIIVPRIAETLNELEQWKSRFADGSCILKGVITHEQLKNETYWIDKK